MSASIKRNRAKTPTHHSPRHPEEEQEAAHFRGSKRPHTEPYTARTPTNRKNKAASVSGTRDAVVQTPESDKKGTRNMAAEERNRDKPNDIIELKDDDISSPEARSGSASAAFSSSNRSFHGNTHGKQRHHRTLLDELSLSLDELMSTARANTSSSSAKAVSALETLRLLREISRDQKGQRLLQTHTKLLEKIVSAAGAFTNSQQDELKRTTPIDESMALAIAGMMYMVCQSGTNIDLVTKASLRTLIFIVQASLNASNAVGNKKENIETKRSQPKQAPKNALRARLQKKGGGQTQDSSNHNTNKNTSVMPMENNDSSQEMREAVAALLSDDVESTEDSGSKAAESPVQGPPSSESFEQSRANEEKWHIRNALLPVNKYAAADLSILCITRCISLGEPQNENGQSIKSYSSWSRRYIEKVANIKVYLGSQMALRPLIGFLVQTSHTYLENASSSGLIPLRLTNILRVLEHMCFMNKQNQESIVSSSMETGEMAVSSVPAVVLLVLDKALEKRMESPKDRKNEYTVFELFSTALRVVMNLANECELGYTAIGQPLPRDHRHSTMDDNATLTGIGILASSLYSCLDREHLNVIHFDEFLHTLGALTNCVEHSVENREKVAMTEVNSVAGPINFLALLAYVFRAINSRLQLPPLSENEDEPRTAEPTDGSDMSTEDLVAGAYITILIGCIVRESPQYLEIVIQGFKTYFDESAHWPPRETIEALLPVLRAFTALQLNAGVLTKEGLNQIQGVASGLSAAIHGGTPSADSFLNQPRGGTEVSNSGNDPFSFDVEE
eukprot:gb/GECG01010666.1/.p1 GENE.gb/GECG01010666.1/~~gb/GECG01010666.1/.p1  ORF type:complete len:791 (+),score=97.22 gb/GECG01010666.1/:1-2373(+)